MSITEQLPEDEVVPDLVAGDYLTREEFLRRWEAAPHVKRAELIGGVVYMPSPLNRDHGSVDLHVATWIGVYMAATPGCEGLSNATWLMGEEDSPQPDTSLRILPERGGQSRAQGLSGKGWWAVPTLRFRRGFVGWAPPTTPLPG